MGTDDHPQDHEKNSPGGAESGSSATIFSPWFPRKSVDSTAPMFDVLDKRLHPDDPKASLLTVRKTDGSTDVWKLEVNPATGIFTLLPEAWS